jgi:hypothetical protein
MYKLISIQFQSFHMYVYISSGVKSQIVGPTYMQWLIPFHVVTRETTTVHGEFDLVFGHSWWLRSIEFLINRFTKIDGPPDKLIFLQFLETKNSVP